MAACSILLPGLSLTWPILCLTAITVLAYGKNLPLMWHFRILSVIGYHNLVKSTFDGPADMDESIFASAVTSSRVFLSECDINVHKSNSTYFSDLDIARVNLLHQIFGDPRRLSFRIRAKYAINACGTARWCLGANSCQWLREIKPYQKYEMHSRILSWDEKWFYIMTHFTEPESAKASSTSSVPYATAIAKVVFKIDRLTVSPFKIMEIIEPSDVQHVMPSLAGKSTVGDRLEQRRQQGMGIASHLAALDDLHIEFSRAAKQRMPMT